MKNRIIKEFYFNTALSLSELSTKFGVSIPNITKIINELISDGLVVEQGFARSSGGRRPVAYSLSADKMFIVAVAMDQLSTRIVIFNLLNREVTKPEMIELRLSDNPDALPALISYIQAHIKNSGIAKDKIIGIGIGMPGFVNAKEGVNYTHLPVKGEKSLRKYLADSLDIPVNIDNDSSLIALAELRFGMAKMKDDVMVINLGWGIGLGMIVSGEIFRGHNGLAGEFSHIPISEDGALCACGKRGCLEAEASMLVVAEKAIDDIKNGRVSSLQDVVIDHTKLAGDAIMEAASKGDQYAVELLSEAGYKIGKALSILIHIMNPETIVLSGRGAVAGKILMAPIQQALFKYCIPRLAENATLQISELGFDGELIGAATLVMENFSRYTNHK